jgi:uncharacterized protein YkwD
MATRRLATVSPVPLLIRFSRWLVLGVALVLGGLAASPPSSALAEGPCTVSARSLAVDSEERAALRALNAHRERHGLAPLRMSVGLNRAAAWMAEDLANRTLLSHTDSLGRGLGPRILDCGFADIGYYHLGENVLSGSTTGQSAVNVFTDSPGHNANQLGEDWMAVGIARDWNPATQCYYWAMAFASELDQPLPMSGWSNVLMSYLRP